MNTDETKITTLPIDDIFCASFVATRGCRLLNVEQSGSRSFFHFSNSKGEASDAVLGFVNDEPVSVRSFVSAYKQFRSLVYTARKAKA